MKKLLFILAAASNIFAPEPFDASVLPSERVTSDSEYVLSAIASGGLEVYLEELSGFYCLTVKKFGPNPAALRAYLYSEEALQGNKLSNQIDPSRGMHRRVNREERQFPRVDHGQITEIEEINNLIRYIASEGLALQIHTLQLSADKTSWEQGEPFTRSGLTQLDIYSMLLDFMWPARRFIDLLWSSCEMYYGTLDLTFRIFPVHTEGPMSFSLQITKSLDVFDPNLQQNIDICIRFFLLCDLTEKEQKDLENKNWLDPIYMLTLPQVCITEVFAYHAVPIKGISVSLPIGIPEPFTPQSVYDLIKNIQPHLTAQRVKMIMDLHQSAQQNSQCESIHPQHYQ